MCNVIAFNILQRYTLLLIITIYFKLLLLCGANLLYLHHDSFKSNHYGNCNSIYKNKQKSEGC